MLCREDNLTRPAARWVAWSVRLLAGLLLLVALLAKAPGSWPSAEAAALAAGHSIHQPGPDGARAGATAAPFRTAFTWPGHTKWTANWLGAAHQVTHPPNPGYELEAFDPTRVAYTGDGLLLSIRDDPVTIDGTTYQYRSGAITGYQQQAYTYGRFSARIFIPCANGTIVNWPAFWLVGNPYKWPATGEIDIIEGLGGHAWWHFHYQDAAGEPASYGGQATSSNCGWHTYAVDWRPTAITWYYDHTLVGTVTSHITSSPMFPVFSYSLTNPNSARCTQHPAACGGPIDITAVMRVRDFSVMR
jgi:beta-glucanase (GH16 family)